jgi:hypothetical protein
MVFVELTRLCGPMLSLTHHQKPTTRIRYSYFSNPPPASIGFLVLRPIDVKIVRACSAHHREQSRVYFGLSTSICWRVLYEARRPGCGRVPSGETLSILDDWNISPVDAARRLGARALFLEHARNRYEATVLELGQRS